MKHKPNEEGVWRNIGTEEKVVCPDCHEETYMYIPNSQNSCIDTIGSVKICSTEKGTYIHGT